MIDPISLLIAYTVVSLASKTSKKRKPTRKRKLK